MQEQSLEAVPCPYCGSNDYSHWALERGFATVICSDCGFLFLSPRPNQAARQQATQLGHHAAADGMDLQERYLPAKTSRYHKLLLELLGDEFSSGPPITWIDIGAGYGETMDAVSACAPKDSVIYGVEPMRPKAQAAKARGLKIFEQALGPGIPECDYASLIDVFSHINDFDNFLQLARQVIKDRGQFLIETGHLDGSKGREDFPGELGLPDHVAFASERHIRGYLERNGFEVISVKQVAIDNWTFAIKNVIKRIIGRNVRIRMPYSSSYRTMFVLSRKIPDYELS